jgi:hypothetical protein
VAGDHRHANGIREVWDRKALAARGSHPHADFGLDVVDGFYTGPAHDVLAAILDVRLAADAAKALDIASPLTTAR